MYVLCPHDLERVCFMFLKWRIKHKLDADPLYYSCLLFVLFHLQADEMPDLPTQSVTEEKYKDENGHVVIKKVKQDSKCTYHIAVFICDMSAAIPKGSLCIIVNELL